MTRKLVDTIDTLVKREFNVRETLTILHANAYYYLTWGVTSLVNMNDKGLLMKVKGHHHKGYVLITLNWMDVYEVHLISTHGTLVKQFDMVYVDELVRTIDEAVEKIPAYAK